MRVTLLGTGTSLPDPERVQSGVLVEAGNQKILFDIGSGVLHRIVQTGVNLTTINTVFISHFHVDHSSDFMTLCQSLWLSGFEGTLHLYAPPPVREWARGIRDIAFPYLREKIHLAISPLAENEAIQVGDAVVSVCPTLHGTVQSRAFRIEYGGHSAVYTSDTAPCPEVIELARDTDLLIHECNWLDGAHPKGVHTAPTELSEVAESTAARLVVLVHVPPEVVNDADRVVKTVGRRTGARVLMGRDLMTLDV